MLYVCQNCIHFFYAKTNGNTCKYCQCYARPVTDEEALRPTSPLYQIYVFAEEVLSNWGICPFTEEQLVILASTAKLHNGAVNAECTICQHEIMPMQKTLTFKCGHIYHDVCLLNWLRERGSCPNCRSNLLSQLMKSRNDYHGQLIEYFEPGCLEHMLRVLDSIYTRGLMDPTLCDDMHIVTVTVHTELLEDDASEATDSTDIFILRSLFTELARNVNGHELNNSEMALERDNEGFPIANFRSIRKGLLYMKCLPAKIMRKLFGSCMGEAVNATLE